MSDMVPLSISYVRAEAPAAELDARREHLLGCVSFARDVPQEGLGALPVVRVNTPLLGQSENVFELWCAGQPVSFGQRGGVRYSFNGDLLFGVVTLLESDFAAECAGVGSASPLQRGTKQAFQDIFGLLDELDYPYILRIWNYFPAINQESYGLERYRQFNIGRQVGFAACGRSLTDNIPAACALGTVGGQLAIYFIAGRNKPIVIENPRQISAYHYPLDYGPRSPTFSRASLGRMAGQEVLFISGTASIIGHRSVHIGDVVAQTRETLVNIDAVVEAANRLSENASYDLASLSYKVYVRRTEDVGGVHSELQRILGSNVRAIYLHADICRQDLLVEIEATAGIPLETP